VVSHLRLFNCEGATNVKLDACQFCLGAKGNTPGNENVFAGVLCVR
jgi:hypothetical protein